MSFEQFVMHSLELDTEYPQLSEYTLPVWRYFNDLSRDRSSNGFGYNAITSSDILAWMTVTGVQLEQWQIGAIRRLDAERNIA